MKTYKQLFFLWAVASVVSCNKSYLEIKPDQTQRVPISISDFQALIHNADEMNVNSSNALGIIGADEYYIPDSRYDLIPSETDFNYMKRAYNWSEIIYSGGENTDWGRAYKRILTANIVLDGLKKITPLPSELSHYNQTKGEALFHRALNYYNLAQLYCNPYNPSTIQTDLGLPLRLEADVTLKIGRATANETYQQILSDLTASVSLLPKESLTVFYPSKAAAYALLSRIYLQIGDFEKALENASFCLEMKNTLLDYNSINLTPIFPFPTDGSKNPEMIFSSNVTNVVTTGFSTMDSDTTLISSYQENDLRPDAFFYYLNGRWIFTGSYTTSLFTGLAVDEVLLTRAECFAREGKLNEALKDLNKLLINRFKAGAFVPVSTSSPDEALAIILRERRKSLLFRGTRWEDLRRLNREERFATTLVRTIKGTKYELLPNGFKYTWPIPLEAITVGGYTQNPR